MKSIANRLKRLQSCGLCSNEDDKKFIQEIVEFEENYYKLKNKHADLIENNEELKYHLNKIRQDDERELTDISKKVAIALKTDGDDEMVNQLILMRAKIMDHFTLAYIAELKCKPSEAKLVQQYTDEGVEFFFEKHSAIIMPGE